MSCSTKEIESIVLHYYNNVLFEKGIISVGQYNQMKVKIASHSHLKSVEDSYQR